MFFYLSYHYPWSLRRTVKNILKKTNGLKERQENDQSNLTFFEKILSDLILTWVTSQLNLRYIPLVIDVYQRRAES